MRAREYPACGERVYRTRLSSGLTVLTVPKPGFGRSFAMLGARFGGANRLLPGSETAIPAGTAHYLEHKLFDMPDGTNVLQRFAERGVTVNAFTGTDLTAFYVDCIRDFRENLAMLLETVKTPCFTPESVEKERGIITQEIRMYQDMPHSAGYQGLMALLLGEHPAAGFVGGSVESIGEITPALLAACHGAFYRPANLVLCAVGELPPELAAETAERVWPEYAGPRPGELAREEKADVCAPRGECRMEVSRPILFLGARVRPAPAGAAALRQKLVAALSLRVLAGPSSVLNDELSRKGLVDESFQSGFLTQGGTAAVVISGESRAPDQVCARLADAAAELAASGPEEGYLERQKRALLGSVIRGGDRPRGISAGLIRGEFEGWDWLSQADVIPTLTADEVRGFLGESLSPERLAVFTVRNKE